MDLQIACQTNLPQDLVAEILRMAVAAAEVRIRKCQNAEFGGTGHTDERCFFSFDKKLRGYGSNMELCNEEFTLTMALNGQENAFSIASASKPGFYLRVDDQEPVTDYSEPVAGFLNLAHIPSRRDVSPEMGAAVSFTVVQGNQPKHVLIKPCGIPNTFITHACGRLVAMADSELPSKNEFHQLLCGADLRKHLSAADVTACLQSPEPFADVGPVAIRHTRYAGGTRYFSFDHLTNKCWQADRGTDDFGYSCGFEKFVVTAPLNGQAGAISIESARKPGFYFTVSHGRKIHLIQVSHPSNVAAELRDDASFTVHQRPGKPSHVAFRPCNDPSKCIIHANGADRQLQVGTSRSGNAYYEVLRGPDFVTPMDIDEILMKGVDANPANRSTLAHRRGSGGTMCCVQ